MSRNAKVAGVPSTESWRGASESMRELWKVPVTQLSLERSTHMRKLLKRRERTTRNDNSFKVEFTLLTGYKRRNHMEKRRYCKGT